MAIPTVISSLVLVIYNIPDTFFIWQTHDALQVTSVSLINAVFVMYMAIVIPTGISSSLMSIATVLLNNALVPYGDTVVATMGV